MLDTPLSLTTWFWQTSFSQWHSFSSVFHKQGESVERVGDSVSLIFFYCDQHLNQKWMGKKAFIGLPLSDHTPPWREVRAGNRDANLEAGTEVETMEGHCLLVYSFLLAEPAFLYSWDHLSTGGNTHIRLGPPTLVISQDSIPRDFSTGWVNAGIFLNWGFSSDVSRLCSLSLPSHYFCKYSSSMRQEHR